MDDASSLEEEFEQELLLEPDEAPPASTPRQRLEDARAMANGNCEVARGEGGDIVAPESAGGDGERPDTSMHLLQRLSCAMTDGGKWKCFHDITHESQQALAEMNETLGSLRQWQKQRKVGSSLSAPNSLQDAPTAAIWDQPSSGKSPSTSLDCSSEPMATLTTSKKLSCGTNADNCRQENDLSAPNRGGLGVEGEDRLLVLWQEHHLRAQHAVERLQEQLDRHPPTLSLKTRDITSVIDKVENGKVDKTTAETAHAKELTIRNLLVGEGAAGSPSGNGSDADNVDRVTQLSRKVDGLQIHQWIQTTRTQACDRAETLAREAGEDIKRGAGCAAVGEIEGKLDGFAQELDSLLLRIDRVIPDDREEGCSGTDTLRLEASCDPQAGLAPVADARVDCASAE